MVLSNCYVHCRRVASQWDEWEVVTHLVDFVRSSSRCVSMAQLPVGVVTPAFHVPSSGEGASELAGGLQVYLDNVVRFEIDCLASPAWRVDWVRTAVHHNLLRLVVTASVRVPLPPATDYYVVVSDVFEHGACGPKVSGAD